MVAINNLARACCLTLEQRQGLLFRLYRGERLDLVSLFTHIMQIDDEIKKIQRKCREENPFGYSIGLMNVSDVELELVKSTPINQHTIECKLINDEVKRLHDLSTMLPAEEGKDDVPASPRRLLGKSNVCSLCDSVGGDIVTLAGRCGHGFHRDCIRLHVTSMR